MLRHVVRTGQGKKEGARVRDRQYRASQLVTAMLSVLAHGGPTSNDNHKRLQQALRKAAH
jgi:hypothetical protein